MNILKCNTREWFFGGREGNSTNFRHQKLKNVAMNLIFIDSHIPGTQGPGASQQNPVWRYRTGVERGHSGPGR